MTLARMSTRCLKNSRSSLIPSTPQMRRRICPHSCQVSHMSSVLTDWYINSHCSRHTSRNQRAHASTNGGLRGHSHPEQHVSPQPSTWNKSPRSSRGRPPFPRLAPQSPDRLRWLSVGLSEQIHKDYRRRGTVCEPFHRGTNHAYSKHFSRMSGHRSFGLIPAGREYFDTTCHRCRYHHATR